LNARKAAAAATATTISKLEGHEDTRPYQNFIQSLKSDYTKHEYKKALSRYLAHYNITPEKMLSLPIEEVENKLVDYLLFMKNQDLSTSFINLNFCSLKHFYFMNNVRINKEKIGKFLGESKKKYVDRGYFDTEIKNILDIADLRFKVVISVLASTGIRIGPLPSVRLSQYRNSLRKKFTSSQFIKTLKTNTLHFAPQNAQTTLTPI